MGNVAPSASIIVCTHVCSVGKSCLTLCEPMDCSPPSSSVHGVLVFVEPPGKPLYNCEKPLKAGSGDTELVTNQCKYEILSRELSNLSEYMG